MLLPEPKKEMTVDKMENGHYALNFVIDGQVRASAFLTPAEAESLATLLLEDVKKSRK